SRLIPRHGTELFGRLMGDRHVERYGQATDRLFLQIIWKSLDDRVDAFRGLAPRCRPVQIEAQFAFPNLHCQPLRRRLLGQEARFVGPDPGPAVYELGDNEKRGRNSIAAQQGVSDLIGVAVTIVNRNRGHAGGERRAGGYALNYSREGDDIVMRRQVLQLLCELTRRDLAIDLIPIGAEAMISEDQRATL